MTELEVKTRLNRARERGNEIVEYEWIISQLEERVRKVDEIRRRTFSNVWTRQPERVQEMNQLFMRNRGREEEVERAFAAEYSANGQFLRICFFVPLGLGP